MCLRVCDTPRGRTMLRLFALIVPVVAVAVPALADDDMTEVPLADSGWLDATGEQAPAADGLLVDFADNLSDDDIAKIEKETGLNLEATTHETHENLYVLH